MSGMPGFTYDVESVVLNSSECVSYALLVESLCNLHAQHEVSCALARNAGPLGAFATDAIQRQALRMWRTGAKL